MGRQNYSNKIEANTLTRIEASFLNKHHYFEGWKSGSIHWTNGWSGYESSVGIEVCTMENSPRFLRIHYTQTDRDTGEKKFFDYKVSLITTPCKYGGKRYWFICPLHKSGISCGRRVSTLYKYGDYFGCRHCYDLTYSSKKMNRRGRLFSTFSFLDIDKKIQKVSSEIKRKTWKRKPTKKQRRLDRLRGQSMKFARNLMEMGEL